jgi:hypothetical protein
MSGASLAIDVMGAMKIPATEMALSIPAKALS